MQAHCLYTSTATQFIIFISGSVNKQIFTYTRQILTRDLVYIKQVASTFIWTHIVFVISSHNLHLLKSIYYLYSYVICKHFSLNWLHRIKDMRSRCWVSAILFAVASLQFVVCDVVVTTKHGKIRGISNNKTKAFLGVPYAAPPVGKLRCCIVSSVN